MKRPDVHYARSGDVAIAYQVVGDGPVDVVYARGMSGDLLSSLDQPLLARHFADLARFSRLLTFDKRGTGLSDGCERCRPSRRGWTTSAPSWTRPATVSSRPSTAPVARSSAPARSAATCAPRL